MTEKIYVLTEKQSADLEKNFTYHPPSGDQPARFGLLRSAAKTLALLISENTPLSREQSLALTNLEQAIFWANAAIARNETEAPPYDANGDLNAAK